MRLSFSLFDMIFIIIVNHVKQRNQYEVIKYFSRLIVKAKIYGYLKKTEVSKSLYITHLQFVDDFLLFGEGSVVEWEAFP